MTAIYRREIHSYLSSLIGYIYIAVFWFFSGFYFWGTTLGSNSTEMSYVFSNLFSICIFLIPILTMRLLSEERRNKTDQLLITAPLSLLSLVLGKFLAALTIFIIGVLQTLLCALLVSAFAPPDWAVVLGNCVGLVLLGAALIAIGLFISSVTENQVIAAIGGFAAGLMLLMLDSLSYVLNNRLVTQVIESLSFNNHYIKFTQGLLDFADITFFVSVAAVFIFMTVGVLARRRWR